MHINITQHNNVELKQLCKQHIYACTQLQPHIHIHTHDCTYLLHQTPKTLSASSVNHCDSFPNVLPIALVYKSQYEVFWQASKYYVIVSNNTTYLISVKEKFGFFGRFTSNACCTLSTPPIIVTHRTPIGSPNAQNCSLI